MFLKPVRKFTTRAKFVFHLENPDRDGNYLKPKINIAFSDEIQANFITVVIHCARYEVLNIGDTGTRFG